MRLKIQALAMLSVVVLGMLLVACDDEASVQDVQDPFSTPEGTLQSLIEALEIGDMNRALDHFLWTGNRDKFESLLNRYGQQAMTDFAADFRNLQLIDKTDERATFGGIATLGGTSSRNMYLHMAKTDEGQWGVLRVD